MLIFFKNCYLVIAGGPQGSWALVHRTTCTTCMAATGRKVNIAEFSRGWKECRAIAPELGNLAVLRKQNIT